MKKLIIAGALAFIAQLVLAQTGWTVKIEPPKRFIENKSQFDGRVEAGDGDAPILYGVDWGTVHILFHQDGLTYHFSKSNSREKEEERERERFKNERRDFTA